MFSGWKLNFITENPIYKFEFISNIQWMSHPFSNIVSERWLFLQHYIAARWERNNALYSWWKILIEKT